MDLNTLLKVLPVVGPTIAKAKEFVDLYQDAMKALKPADQVTAKAALADIQSDNDAGHRRLQEKLAEAAKR